MAGMWDREKKNAWAREQYQRRLAEAKAAGPEALAALREKINSKRRGQKGATTAWRHHKQRREARLLHSAKIRAKKSGVLFSITQKDLDWPNVCPVLGTLLDYSRRGERLWEFPAENIPSIDQIIPGGGYVPGNVAVISWKANMIKNCGTAEDHRKVADWMDERMSW